MNCKIYPTLPEITQFVLLIVPLHLKLTVQLNIHVLPSGKV